MLDRKSILAAAILFTASSAHAQSSTDPEDVIDNLRETRKEGVSSHLGRGMIDPILRPLEKLQLKLDEKYELGLYAHFSPVIQATTDAETANYSFDVFGRWDNIIKSGKWIGDGSIDLYATSRGDDWTGTTTAEFQALLGLAMPVNDNNVNGTQTSLAQFSWEQRMFDEFFELVFGQLDPVNIWDKNRFAGYDRVSFLHKALSANPVRPFPGSGLGLSVELSGSRGFHLKGGIMDADANNEYPDFDSLGDSEWATFGELRIETAEELYGKGNYRFGFQHIDETIDGPEDTAFSFSFDQELSDDVGAYFRYGNGDGNRTRIRYFLSTGLVWKQPIISTDDWLGFGYFWSRPRENRREYGGEIYWRIQLTRRAQLTPDVMFIRPSDVLSSGKVETLFNLRLLIAI
jgi:hypothetical protein